MIPDAIPDTWINKRERVEAVAALIRTAYGSTATLEAHHRGQARVDVGDVRSALFWAKVRDLLEAM
jgi:hypothetical protein